MHGVHAPVSRHAAPLHQRAQEQGLRGGRPRGVLHRRGGGRRGGRVVQGRGAHHPGRKEVRRALPRLRTLSRFLFDDSPQVYYVLCFSPLFCTVQASLSVFSFWYSVSPFFPTLFICRHRRRKMLPSARVAFFANPAELLYITLIPPLTNIRR